MRAWLAICASIGALTWPSARARATSLRNWSIRGACCSIQLVDRTVRIVTAAPRQELDAQLLEIARQAGGQQPLPLVGGDEARDLLLRPVEAERLAEPGVGASHRELVDLAARGERGNPEHAVELVQADEPADDVLACAERDQSVAPGGGFVAHLRADQLGRGSRILRTPGSSSVHSVPTLVSPPAARRMSERCDADACRGDREQLDADRFGQRVLLNLAPQAVEIEQPLGDEERRHDLLERGAFLLGQVERHARARAG